MPAHGQLSYVGPCEWAWSYRANITEPRKAGSEGKKKKNGVRSWTAITVQSYLPACYLLRSDDGPDKKPLLADRGFLGGDQGPHGCEVKSGRAASAFLGVRYRMCSGTVPDSPSTSLRRRQAARRRLCACVTSALAEC